MMMFEWWTVEGTSRKIEGRGEKGMSASGREVKKKKKLN